MNTKDLKMSTRLALGFSAMGALLVLIAAIALVKVAAIGGEFKTVTDDRYVKIVEATAIKHELNDVARATRNMLIMTDAADVKQQFDDVTESVKIITDQLGKLDKSIANEAGKAALAKVMAARAAYIPSRDKVLEQVKAGKLDEAKATLLKENRPAQLV